jgi:hypothetical protein
VRSGSPFNSGLSLWHLTSLDAPTVAVVWTLAFAWAAQVHLPIWLPCVLALAAWSFYIADRLLDARSAYLPKVRNLSNTTHALSLRPRHHFHWQHRRLFLPIAVFAGVLAVALVFYWMPVTAQARNSALAAAAVIYFTSVHSPWRIKKLKLHPPKELLVGILFTAACAVPSWARIPVHRSVLLVPILAFIGLAWLNCHAIEVWESTSPRSRTPIFRIAIGLAISTLASGAVTSALHQPRVSALLATASGSAFMLAMLDRYRHRFTAVSLRACADLVLLIPILLLGYAR